MSRSFTLLNQGQSRAEFPLKPGILSVGRSSGCDLVVTDSSVSRRHAEVCIDDSGIWVRDLGSLNGTYVDGKRIETSTVTPGQQLSFGKVSFILRAHGAAEDSDCSTEGGGGAPSSLELHPRALLSRAERRVFDLLIEGMAEKQIGRRLHISQHTVHCHVRAIYQVFEVHSKSELLAQVLRARI
jgi:DNA-binding CsgD family transcriptional regulator